MNEKMMFEYVDGKSNKFWEIELGDTYFVTRYGKIGTPGQSTTKQYGDEQTASKEAQKIIGEKIKKGYVKVEV